VEKEVVEKEPVKIEESVKEEVVTEGLAKQPPTEKKGIVSTLRELKRKISGRLLCMS